MKRLGLLCVATLMLTTNVFASEKLNIETIVEETRTEYNLNESPKNVAETLVENVEIPNEKTRVSGCHTPNTAFYLSSSNLNAYLGDTANELQNWYYFYTNPSDKINVFLQDTSTGDYDLYLYKYYEDGSLSLVAYSENTGQNENLSYIGDDSDTGYYWLLINPYVSATPSETYVFRVDTSSSYDSFEPNESISDVDSGDAQVTLDSNSVVGASATISGTIDSPHDVDWYKIDIGNSIYTELEVNADSSVKVEVHRKLLGGVTSVYSEAYGGETIALPFFTDSMTYFLRVTGTEATTYDLDFSRKIIGGVTISNLEVTGDMASCDYNDNGYKLRAEHKMYVSGTVTDASGVPVNLGSDLEITFTFDNPYTYQNSTNPFTETILVDANGEFNVAFDLPHARGVFTWLGYTTHYYDIADYSLKVKIDNNTYFTESADIYHYAYAIYSGY